MVDQPRAGNLCQGKSENLDCLNGLGGVEQD